MKRGLPPPEGYALAKRMWTILTKFLDTVSRRIRGRPLPSWLLVGELSATGSELRYWREAGLDAGTDIYERYLTLFNVTPRDFAQKVVGDFGCGPFGGIMSELPDCSAAYPIDVLADEYNAWGKSRHTIYAYDGGPTEVPGEACDAFFCTNALDHTPYAQQVVDEIFRILRPGGILYLHMHLREKHELNKTHPIPWSVEKARKVLDGFEIIREEELDHDWVNGAAYRTLVMELRKPLERGKPQLTMNWRGRRKPMGCFL